MPRVPVGVAVEVLRAVRALNDPYAAVADELLQRGDRLRCAYSRPCDELVPLGVELISLLEGECDVASAPVAADGEVDLGQPGVRHVRMTSSTVSGFRPSLVLARGSSFNSMVCSRVAWKWPASSPSGVCQAQREVLQSVDQGTQGRGLSSSAVPSVADSSCYRGGPLSRRSPFLSPGCAWAHQQTGIPLRRRTAPAASRLSR